MNLAESTIQHCDHAGFLNPTDNSSNPFTKSHVGNAVQITYDSENAPEAWQNDRLWRDIIHDIFSPNETFFEAVSVNVREHWTTDLEILGKRNRKEAQF
jgi:hypothetical protein